MNVDLPGLRPLKRHIAIRAQEGLRHLLPGARDCMSLSEIAQLAVDAGVVPDIDQATWFVVRAFERRELADGLAQLVHDGRVETFSPEDLIPAKKQKREGSPSYVRGGAGDFTCDSATRLSRDLLDFLYVPLEAVRRFFALMRWPWNGPRPVSSGAPLPAQPGPPGRGPLYKRGRRPSVQQPAFDLMLGKLRAGEITPAKLQAVKKSALPGLWGLKGSPNPLWTAKEKALRIYEQECAGQKI